MKETEGLFRFARLLKRLAVGIAALAIGVVAVGYLFFIRQVNKQDAWTAAERELRENVLQYGEPIVRLAHVYIRRPTSYFRGAVGVLAATPRRLLYVVLEPRDKLASADAPPAILTSEFLNDTALTIRLHRVYLFTAAGITLHRLNREETFASARGYESELDSVAAFAQRQHAIARAQAARERMLRAQVDSILRLPLHYEVRRGDALSTIASRFGATQDEIRRWNGLTGDRVKIGQVLLVKPEGIRRPAATRTADSARAAASDSAPR